MMIDGIDRDNLQTLASFLFYDESVREVEFDMRMFSKDPDASAFGCTSTKPFCEAAGCAVGFAPYAGIVKLPDETFTSYCIRTLIDDYISDENDEAWDWCFGANWADYDNTKKGAGQRIQYFLDYGVPEDYNHFQADHGWVTEYENKAVVPRA